MVHCFVDIFYSLDLLCPWCFTNSFVYYLIQFVLYWNVFLWHRDGTSIILSDDVGQLYILSTGQGESQKDAKYDQVHLSLPFYDFLLCLVFTLMLSANIWQFFLGDYRPLIQDTHGNVLDQVSWLLACLFYFLFDYEVLQTSLLVLLCCLLDWFIYYFKSVLFFWGGVCLKFKVVNPV